MVERGGREWRKARVRRGGVMLCRRMTRTRLGWRRGRVAQNGPGIVDDQVVAWPAPSCDHEDIDEPVKRHDQQRLLSNSTYTHQ